MTHTFDGNRYILVFQKDDVLHAELESFIKETDIQTAWLEGIGGAIEVELGYYNLEKKEYQWRTFSQVCEIVSLKGNVARDNKNEPVFHLHGVFSDEAYQTIGGHVNKLIVGGTCEVIVSEFSQPLKRQFDDQTGLRLLDLS